MIRTPLTPPPLPASRGFMLPASAMHGVSTPFPLPAATASLLVQPLPLSLL